MLEAEIAAMPQGERLGTVVVQPFDTLLMHFVQEIGAGVIVRGLRSGADFEYEFQMVAMNRQLDDGPEHVFLMAEPEHQAIASRLVKEIARLGGTVSAFVTPAVNEALKRRFSG